MNFYMCYTHGYLTVLHTSISLHKTGYDWRVAATRHGLERGRHGHASMYLYTHVCVYITQLHISI